jgi:putative tryptophan/tyrosine transport system substrate-binding protein
MRRREFVCLLGGGACGFFWPVPARTQQSGKLRIIGHLGSDPSALVPWMPALIERLRELGWVEGRTVAIEHRYSEGQAERAAEIAAEFVQKKVDVIFTYGSAVPTVEKLTTTIPIVFITAMDPVGGGLVASLSRPGGNVTGLSLQTTDLVGKRLELLREIVPSLRRLGIMFTADSSQAVFEEAAVQVAARRLGLEVMSRGVRRAEDVASVFHDLHSLADDALYLAESSVVLTNRSQIVALALDARLPTTFNFAASVRAGGLMSYGANIQVLFRRTADLVDKILRGANPGDIPVEQPTKFDLVINLKTAKALGLAVHDKMLALADEVIE